MSAVRPVMCTMGIYQGNETSGHLPTEHGSLHGPLHRRHTPDGRIGRAGDTSSRSTSLPADRAGFIINVPKSVTIPSQQIEFLRLYHITVESTRRENSRLKVTEERSGDSMPTGSNNRETACDIPSSPPNSPVLLFPSRGFTEGTE